MKNKIIGLGIAGGLIAALVLLGTMGLKQGPLDGEAKSESLSNSAVTRPILSRKTVVPASVNTNNSKAFSPRVRPDIIDERQLMQADGTLLHEMIVRKEGKYSHRLVQETLRQDRQLRKFVSSGRTEMVADHVLVSLRDGVGVEELEELGAPFGATILRPLSDGNTFVVQLAAPTLDAVTEAIEEFSKAAVEVAYAEPNYVRHFSKMPNDPMYPVELWGMDKVSAPAAWDISTGDNNVIVAVLDTGMDMDHPDLLFNLWNNDGEIAGDGLDNDGNGFVDDVNGWDFVAEDNDPDDTDGHGTHTAGTVGAVGNNANQVVGICWSVSLMPVQAGTGDGLFDSDIVESIRYAARNGAKVLSNSYGGAGFSQTVFEAIEFANSRGAIFVAAAGNDASDNDSLPQYPASYDLPNVISVAASDNADHLASFSNYGENSVDLAAPGVDIVSTYLNGGTTSLQGTSMACPLVAGAMGLLVSIEPNITPAAAKVLLLDSVDPVLSLSGKTVSGGRMNVEALFANASDLDGDGMTDSWEVLYGLDPNDPSDADLDNDADFLTNLLEFQNGTIPTNMDTDTDSLIDGWEVEYGFNPLNMFGPLPRLQYLGRNSACQDAYDVAIQGNYAYVADGEYGLCILDITNPQSPTLVGIYASGGSARGVEVVGIHVYLSDIETGLHVVDVSNPALPLLRSAVEMEANNAAVEGDYAYVATGERGLVVVSIADPAAAAIVGEIAMQAIPTYDVAVSGGFAYLAADGYFFKVSISNPANPSLSDSNYVLTPTGLRKSTAMFFNGDNFFLTMENYGFSVFSQNFSFVNRYDGAFSPMGICENDGLIYLADGTEGLVVLNGADLSNITEHSKYKNVFAQNVTFAGGFAYVAGRTGGVHIFLASADADEDGMYDKWEIDNFGSLSQGAYDDYDGDEIVNWGEYLTGLNPTNADQDADGLIDGTDEVRTYLTDPRTSDTDEDGLSDRFEVTTNGVDNIYLTNPLKADTDGDGMGDQWEIDHGLDPTVADGEDDLDNDGATNVEESLAGTDPSNPDTDGDGMPDGWEIDMNIDPLVDDAADDPDADTLNNLFEYNLLFTGTYTNSTNPLKADTDEDGLTDTEEIDPAVDTDPNNPDTDGDGMPDGWELDNGLDPLIDDAGADLDGDTLSNYEEFLNGSNPNNPDSDSDGFSDDWERDWETSATNAADPLVVDDNHPDDPQAGDPLWGNTNENGSITAPFDAIQEAIDVASNGVTVLVMDGLYNGPGNFNINPQGKALVIRSYNGASNTVVTSYGIGAGFIFQNDETTNTVLRGFSITTTLNACSDGDCDQRHGIVCDAASPLIRDCIIYECELRGISCTFGASPIISNCVVSTCLYGIYAEGGSTPVILDTLVQYSGNHVNIERTGLGITALESDGLVISNCIVKGTTGRGIFLRNDASVQIFDTTIFDNLGGVSLDNSSPVFERCEFRDNIAPDYFTIGGAVHLSPVNQAETCAAVPDWDDITDEDENGGAVLSMRGSFPYFENCLITSNKTVAIDPDYPENKFVPDYGLGGGIYVDENCEATAINCTLADNSAFTRGGGFSNTGGGINFLRNMVIWGNTAFNHYLTLEDVLSVASDDKFLTFPSLHCRSGSIDIWYSDIEHEYAGAHNIIADPLFVGNGNYRLGTGSPCIDSGGFYFQNDPLIQAPNHDADGLDRPLDGDGDGTNTVDMGAHEFINPIGDTDGDSMPDAWELSHGLDMLFDDNGLDPDADGLTNLEEYEQVNGVYGQSTDPNDSDSDDDNLSDSDEVNIHGTDPNNPDTDGDGMLDGWEVEEGLNPLFVDTSGDADGDGLSNYEESLLGSDPFNADTDGDGFNDMEERNQNTDPTNSTDPLIVDDNHPSDPVWWDPLISSANENGSIDWPFDSIQEAINAASDNVKIIVMGGEYDGSLNRNIDTQGKILMIEGVEGASSTTVYADGLGSGFVFQSGETTNTVIKGFTITTAIGSCEDGSCGNQNAILCKDMSSPYIVDCVITNNELSGIECQFGSSPVIENCDISLSSKGINCSGGSSPYIINSRIYNVGTGVASLNSQGLEIVDSIIENCWNRGVLVENDTALSIKGSEIKGNRGGGLRAENCVVNIDQTKFLENIAPDYYKIEGGIIDIPSLTNIAFYAANTNDWTDVTDDNENGAGILLLDGSVMYAQNTLIADNEAVASDPDYPENKAWPDYGLGGGIYVGEDCWISNMNCTVANNIARRGGGISSHGSHADHLRNVILWDNVAEDLWISEVEYSTTNTVISGISGDITNYTVTVETTNYNVKTTLVNDGLSSLQCRSGDGFDVEYCDVEHGGEYISQRQWVIEEDPLFVGVGDYHLSSNSPCVDVGTSTQAPVDDLDGVPRGLDGNNDGNPYLLYDFGAYESIHRKADTDGDAVLDVDEVEVGTDPFAVDTDGDGIPDGYEAENGLNGTADDSYADADGDGMSNADEYANGTAANNSDTDGDHSPDGDEDIAGTDPLDGASYFYVSNIQPLIGGGCELTFDSAVGRTYTVYCCTTLGGEWNLVESGIPGTGAPVVVEDLLNESSCFYQVEVAK